MARSKGTRFSSLFALVLFSFVLLAAPAVAWGQGHHIVWQEILLNALGRPASGYWIDDRAYPAPRNYIVGPAVGWNESRTAPDGRTGWTAEPVRVRHQGQGDAGPVSVYCATEGARNPLALDWGAEKACFLVNGQVEARVAGTSLAGFEFHGMDNGFGSVSAYMGVLEYNRQGEPDAAPWQPVTGLLRLQSVGKPVDSLASLYGAADVGIDLTGQTSGDLPYVPAIAIAEEGRIYWRARPAQPPHATQDLGSTWTGFHPVEGEGGAWLVTVEDQTTLQVWRDWVVVNGSLSVVGELLLLGLPEGPSEGQGAAPGLSGGAGKGKGRALCLDDAGRVYVAPGGRC